MPRHAISCGISPRNCSNLTMTLVQLIALSLIVIPLTGCGADGQGGPVLSSLSTPADSPSGEGVPPAPGSPETDSTAGEDPTASAETAATDSTANEAEVLDTAADIAEPGDGEEDPTISVTSTPTGATAQLTWDASADPAVSNYYVYYGKQSSGEPGSCSYEASQSVETPPATITGLEPNTLYFFAISANGESESPCSHEVLVVTPPIQG